MADETLRHLQPVPQRAYRPWVIVPTVRTRNGRSTRTRASPVGLDRLRPCKPRMTCRTPRQLLKASGPSPPGKHGT
jgi:hypothetical protein